MITVLLHIKKFNIKDICLQYLTKNLSHIWQNFQLAFRLFLLIEKFV